jgi:hypothetical protein
MHAQIGVVRDGRLTGLRMQSPRRPESVAEPQPANIGCQPNHFIYAQRIVIAGPHRVYKTGSELE